MQTNGRVNEIWQSGFEDVERRPYATQRWPEDWVEIHPVDAEKRGIESGVDRLSGRRQNEPGASETVAVTW